MIEFQKGGLPYAHFFIILKTNAKLIALESFDTVVCVELPNQTKNEKLYSAIIKHMLHSLCSHLNLNNVWWKKMENVKTITLNLFVLKLA